MNNSRLITAGSAQGQVQRIGHILSFHRGAQFPRDDVAAVVIQDRTEIEPTQADDLEMLLPPALDFQIIDLRIRPQRQAGLQEPVMCLTDLIRIVRREIRELDYGRKIIAVVHHVPVSFRRCADARFENIWILNQLL